MIFVRAKDVKDNLKVHTDLANRTVVVTLNIDWLKETMYEMGVENISSKVRKQLPNNEYFLSLDVAVAFRRAISFVFKKHFKNDSYLIARATCHEDDIFDWNIGYNLAKERLLVKIRRIEAEIADEAIHSIKMETRIMESYYEEAFHATLTDLIKNYENISNVEVKVIDD